jgi:hypothetical protein
MEDMRLTLKYVIVGIPHECLRQCEQTLRNIASDRFLRLRHHVPLPARWRPSAYRTKRSEKVELLGGNRSGALWLMEQNGIHPFSEQERDQAATLFWERVEEDQLRRDAERRR